MVRRLDFGQPQRIEACFWDLLKEDYCDTIPLAPLPKFSCRVGDIYRGIDG